MKDLIYLVPLGCSYEALSREIEVMAPRAIPGSSTLLDYNKLLVRRR